ncbi:MAG: BatA domain-containing protein [Pirellulales bacterium]
MANPLILGWLAAASAPIVIHLLNRRKFRESSWAAMQFLLAAVKKNSRRMQLEQWLLLAVRTLLILLAVIAAAEPGFRGAEQLTASGERVHRVIVVDGSFSMNYRPTGQLSYFEQARELAERIVDNSREGDGLSLVVLGTPSRTIVGPPLFRKDEMRGIVDDLRQPHGAGNLAQCLNELDRLLAKSRELHPQIGRRIVYFITDLGKQTWEPEDAARGTDALAEFQTRCERWGGQTGISLIDVGAAEADNTAVVSLEAAEPYAVVGLPTTIRAVVRNFGRQARSQVPIALNVDGRKVEEKFVNLEPAGETTVEFEYPAANPPRTTGHGDVRRRARARPLGDRQPPFPRAGDEAELARARAPRADRLGRRGIRP